MKIIKKTNGKTTASLSKNEWLKLGEVAGWAENSDIKIAQNLGSEINLANTIRSGFNDIYQRYLKTIDFLKKLTPYVAKSPELKIGYNNIQKSINELGNVLKTVIKDVNKPISTTNKIPLTTNPEKNLAPSTPQPSSSEPQDLKSKKFHKNYTRINDPKDKKDSHIGFHPSGSSKSDKKDMIKKALMERWQTPGTLYDRMVKEVKEINDLINKYYIMAEKLSSEAKNTDVKNSMGKIKEDLKKIKLPAYTALNILGMEDELFEYDEDTAKSTKTQQPAKPVQTQQQITYQQTQIENAKKILEQAGYKVTNPGVMNPNIGYSRKF